jgi:hypothetical protein
MTKILMGLAAAVVIAVGGYFGFEFYTQHRIAGERPHSRRFALAAARQATARYRSTCAAARSG